MIQEQHQSIVPLLKTYNACLISTIITIQAALSFAIPFFTGTNHLLSWTLASCVLVLHLVGAYCFHLSLKNLGLQRPRMIALYLIVPFTNIPCVIDLSKAVNAKMRDIGASRGMSLGDIRAIEERI
jgi:uncharacterized membrane-anchored protein YitT (DUF2179 family)